MSQFKIQRLKKGERLSASNWNAMADRLEALFNIGVSSPLTMSAGPSGVVFGASVDSLQGVIAKAKLKTGTWCDIKDWSLATVGSNEQQCVWDFELPKTAKFTDTNPNNWMSTTDWVGSGDYVKAFCLSRHYVPKNVFVLLFKAGTDNQYFFDYHMPPEIYGTLDADFNETDGAAGKLMTIDSAFAGEFQGTKIQVYDKMLNAGKKLASGSKIWAGLSRHSGTGADPFCWKYYVLQSKACPVSAT